MNIVSLYRAQKIFNNSKYSMSNNLLQIACILFLPCCIQHSKLQHNLHRTLKFSYCFNVALYDHYEKIHQKDASVNMYIFGLGYFAV